jgi:hypothetical protein
VNLESVEPLVTAIEAPPDGRKSIAHLAAKLQSLRLQAGDAIG